MENKEKLCKNCKFWRLKGEWSECMNNKKIVHMEWDIIPPRGIATHSVFRDPDLYTHREFGCVNFEERV